MYLASLKMVWVTLQIIGRLILGLDCALLLIPGYIHYADEI